MHKVVPVMIILAEIMILLLVACGAGGGSDPAARAVESYLNALVSKDMNRLSTLSCAEWATDALAELDSLQAVSVRLEDLSCQTSDTDGSTTLVSCYGKLLATYDGEDQELDISGRTYQVVQQAGEYLMCGYR